MTGNGSSGHSYIATGFSTPAMIPSSTALPSSSRKESFTPLASSRAAIFLPPFRPDTCGIQAEELIRSSQNTGRKTGEHLAVGYSTKNASSPLGNSSRATIKDSSRKINWRLLMAWRQMNLYPWWGVLSLMNHWLLLSFWHLRAINSTDKQLQTYLFQLLIILCLYILTVQNQTHFLCLSVPLEHFFASSSWTFGTTTWIPTQLFLSPN